MLETMIFSADKSCTLGSLRDGMSVLKLMRGEVRVKEVN